MARWSEVRARIAERLDERRIEALKIQMSQPSQPVQVAAARARVAADLKRGVETPEWIKQLALQEKSYRESQ